MLIEEKIQALRLIETSLEEKFKLMEECANKAKSVIKLDIGGKIFKISKESLLSKKDTFFYAMISSGVWLPDENGSYFIDRNPKMVPYILDYLRYGTVDVSGLTIPELISPSTKTDCFSLTQRDLNCISLSDNNKTATVLKVSIFGMLGEYGILFGKRTWKLKIKKMKSSSKWSIGITDKPYKSVEGFSTHPDYYASSIYESSYRHEYDTVKDWIQGDVIQVDIDCDVHFLSIKNLRSGHANTFHISPATTYFLFVFMNSVGDSITLE